MEWRLFPIQVFDKYRQKWDELNSSNFGTPLLDSRFVMALIEQFGTGEEKLAIGVTGVDPCCMAIVTKTRLGVWRTFQPSQAPIGCWIQEASMSIELLGGSLRKALPGAPLILGITQQDPSLVPRPENSGQTETIDYITTARVPVEGSFEDFWSKRGKNLRQNLRRQRNRLNREEVEISFSAIIDPQSMYDAVKQYGDLESAGWKSDSNTAIHIDNPQGLFYAKVLKQFAATNQAIVFQYRYDDQLVATDLCIMGGGGLIILKTTYDESITTSSPAMLMREESFNFIFTKQLAERIEFYGKVMDWHTKWANDVRNMYHINLYSRIGSRIKAVYGHAKSLVD